MGPSSLNGCVKFKIEDGSVKFKFISTKQQITNELTKALTKEKFFIL